MRFFTISATISFTFFAAIFALPLLNTISEIGAAASATEAALQVSSPVEQLEQSVSVETAEQPKSANPSIPVTDEEISVIPVIGTTDADIVELDTVVEVIQSAEEEAAVLAELAEQEKFEAFVASVNNGYANLVTGVYIPNQLSLPILQQPNSNPGYITMQAGAATQFGMASDYGAIGILAHNFLVGSEFFNLAEGMEVYIVYGDGSYSVYLISEIRRFQALQPNSPYSNFLDLDNDDDLLSAAQLFDQIYNQPGNVIFQTCIDANGINTWGRIFVTAEPIVTS